MTNDEKQRTMVGISSTEIMLLQKGRVIFPDSYATRMSSVAVLKSRDTVKQIAVCSEGLSSLLHIEMCYSEAENQLPCPARNAIKLDEVYP